MRVHSHRKPVVQVVTLGCSKNLVDSEVMMAQLRGNDFEVHHQKPDVESDIVIINTCGFIDRAKEESIQTILQFAQAKEQGYIQKLMVTGCLSQRYREDLTLEIPEVDAWFGTLELPSLLERLGADYKKELLGERILATEPHFAYLKISEGCNRTCSFCAIPLMRGKHVSRSIDEIVSEARLLASKGVKELMLIAQELTYYGLDLYKKRRLPDLLAQLAEVEGIRWIRLHYAYPHKFPLDILPVIRDTPNICRYLDMPLQHISDRMLSAMKRQITRAETEALLHHIRSVVPDMALRTTFLLGFPGETEDDVEELEQFIQSQSFARVGVFTYSHEEGTSGHLLVDDVPAEEKEARAERIMNIQSEIAFEWNQQWVGQTLPVLIDRKEGGFFVGRTEFDSPEVDNEVLISADSYCRIGDFVQARIISAETYELYAEIDPTA